MIDKNKIYLQRLLSEAKKDKKKAALGVAVGAAAVLVIGGGIAALWGQVFKGSSLEVPVGANLIPQDALMTISLSTDAGEWQRLREFGTPQSRDLLDRKLVELRDRFLTENGYDYEQDIKPWVGDEVMIAFLSPFTVKPANVSQPKDPTQVSTVNQALVMVLPVANSDRAKKVLLEPKPLKNGKWVDRIYKGVQIKETLRTLGENFSVTVLDGRFLAIANDRGAIDRTIDTYSGGASIVATPGYAEAWQPIKNDQSFAKLYVNLPVATGVFSLNSPELDPDRQAEKQQTQGFASTITLDSEGIRFKTVEWLKPNTQRKYTVENNAKTMVKRLPGATMMMMSGGNIQRVWQDYAAGAQGSPLAPISPQTLRTDLKNSMKLDLEKDLLGWMRGEFSVSLIPARQETGSRFPAGMVLMVQASDRSLGEKTFQKLDDVMSKQYKFKVETAKLAGEYVVNLTSEEQSLTVSHGWLNGNVAFLSVGAPVANTLIPQPRKSLAVNEEFQKTVSKELEPNNGHFFIDIERTIDNNKPMWVQFPPEQKMVVNAIRAIGVTAAIQSDRMTRHEVFVHLKKEGKPDPLPSPGALGTGSSAPSPSPGAKIQPTPKVKP